MSRVCFSIQQLFLWPQSVNPTNPDDSSNPNPTPTETTIQIGQIELHKVHIESYWECYTNHSFTMIILKHNNQIFKLRINDLIILLSSFIFSINKKGRYQLSNKETHKYKNFKCNLLLYQIN
ncbi:unnamed protein product (macronuclear) [Paramecium tetraurelia]|uniref:Uncharacterized protein n=1 Tax=Paramecium tetraurelia TaxID=5888 RepID=A0C396_PARTE|nr:uncharacterized protein GSPATT00034741001 [Paramecium tetraurelia]CAK65263.1 unnamed protein product [Paramecium tetraurelia]|eukprot:XP_001432660.1 hypothetical protein (macronuclear) [Paramecium tetraurelia strain d4-2]